MKYLIEHKEDGYSEIADIDTTWRYFVMWATKPKQVLKALREGYFEYDSTELRVTPIKGGKND